jgi:hypothetical protein
MPFEPGEGGDAYLARSASASCDRPSWWRSCRILRPSGEDGPSVGAAPGGRDDRTRREAVRRLSVMTGLVTGSGARRYMSGVHVAKVAHQEPVGTSLDDIPRRHTGCGGLAAYETE